MTDPTFDLERVLASGARSPRDRARRARPRGAARAPDGLPRRRAPLRAVIGFDDPAVTAAAYVGFGEALYRMTVTTPRSTWEQATRLPDNPSTYLAWRNVAAGKVRAQDLRGAFEAYKEAERRAPDQDKTEIATRLGWLSKELGDTSAAGKYFARARGDTGLSFSVALIAVTVIVAARGARGARRAGSSRTCSRSTRPASRMASCGACGP